MYTIAYKIQFNTYVEFNTDQSIHIDYTYLSLMFNHQFNGVRRLNDNIAFKINYV